MKYLDEYRDGDIARKIVDEIHRIQTKPWVIMEVCGGLPSIVSRFPVIAFTASRNRMSRCCTSCGI